MAEMEGGRSESVQAIKIRDRETSRGRGASFVPEMEGGTARGACRRRRRSDREIRKGRGASFVAQMEGGRSESVHAIKIRDRKTSRGRGASFVSEIGGRRAGSVQASKE